MTLSPAGAARRPASRRAATMGGVAEVKERNILRSEEPFDGGVEIVRLDQRRIDDFFGFRIGADDELLPEVVLW